MAHLHSKHGLVQDEAAAQSNIPDCRFCKLTPGDSDWSDSVKLQDNCVKDMSRVIADIFQIQPPPQHRLES